MKITIYAGPPLRDAFARVAITAANGGNKSGRINNLAERYLKIVAAAMPPFSRNEWCAIMDANNGMQITGDLTSVMHVWANVADDHELDAKWQIDHKTLAARLDALPVAGKVAVGEAIERFWTHPELPTDQALAVAGVVLEENLL